MVQVAERFLLRNDVDVIVGGVCYELFYVSVGERPPGAAINGFES